MAHTMKMLTLRPYRNRISAVAVTVTVAVRYGYRHAHVRDRRGSVQSQSQHFRVSPMDGWDLSRWHLRDQEPVLLTCSILFLASCSGFLSLMSFELCHVFICSRKRWSFFISFFSSDSYFSFWLTLVAVCTCMRLCALLSFCQTSSNASTPSVTFFRVFSISPWKKKKRRENGIRGRESVKLSLTNVQERAVCVTYLVAVFCLPCVLGEPWMKQGFI